MPQIYNTIGSLTVVKSHLEENGIRDFSSLKEVIDFQKNFTDLQRAIIEKTEAAISQEKNLLTVENPLLEISISETVEAARKILQEELQTKKNEYEHLLNNLPTGFIQKIAFQLKKATLKRKIEKHELSIETKVAESIKPLKEQLQKNTTRLAFIEEHFQKAVEQKAENELTLLNRKKNIIDQVSSSIYGAIGEQMVVKELSNLPDDYYLINDLCLEFKPALYNQKENEYIRSIQADHVVVAPSGIFLIETKHWSAASINDETMRSPISQLKRTSFALFRVLNEESKGLNVLLHHWGKKKVAIRNLLVLTNQKTQAEFQFVKVLGIQQLLKYITYFPPIYTKKETQSIANQLIKLSGSKPIIK